MDYYSLKAGLVGNTTRCDNCHDTFGPGRCGLVYEAGSPVATLCPACMADHTLAVAVAELNRKMAAQMKTILAGLAPRWDAVRQAVVF